MSSRTWLLLLLVTTVAARFPTMVGVKRSGWDERAYVVFAETLDKGGVAGIRQWLRDYPTNENLQKSPLMLRVGFIVPAMFVCKMLGGFTVDHLAWLSFASGVIFVLLGARFVEQLADLRMSILCGILLVTSPLAVGLARRATQDSFVSLVMLACLYFFDRCWRRRSAIDLSMLAGLLTLALLTKESALLLWPMLAIAGTYYFWGMKLRASPWLLLPLVAAPITYLAIEIAICGSFGNFVRAFRTYAALQQTLDYTVHYEKGPWFRYLVDWLAIAPVAFIASMAGFFGVRDIARHGRNLAVLYFASAVLLFGQMPIVNIRLVLFSDVFLRFAAVLGMTYLAAKINGAWSRRLLCSGIALVVLTDIFQFYQLFVVGNVYSPTTFLLLRADGFYDVQ